EHRLVAAQPWTRLDGPRCRCCRRQHDHRRRNRDRRAFHPSHHHHLTLLHSSSAHLPAPLVRPLTIPLIVPPSCPRRPPGVSIIALLTDRDDTLHDRAEV